MTKVIVYKCKYWDATNDNWNQSRRWFTRDGAECARCIIIEDSEIEINEEDLDRYNTGMTPIDYMPRRDTLLCKQV